jgi:hypothetical protein
VEILKIICGGLGSVFKNYLFSLQKLLAETMAAGHQIQV